MNKILQKYRNLIIGCILLVFGYYFPEIFNFFLVKIIVDIRKAIVSGDSGHIVLTAAVWSFFFMLQQVMLLNGVLLITRRFAARVLPFKWIFILSYLFIYGFVLIVVNQYSFLPLEFFQSILAGAISLTLMSFFSSGSSYVERNVIISVQVFFAMEWINIMPSFSSFGFGITDMPASIKVASIYLGSTSVLDFIGLVFMITFVLSTIMTSFLFSSYDRNIMIARENYEKELALDTIRQKAVQNRMYEEINAITHDLKTPLVTIKGLNSLISISEDPIKKIEYTERIDRAVTTMTEMISGFLYEKSKQIVSTTAIIDYIRSQIPLENNKLSVVFNLEKDLPNLFINKVRVSRAVINIIENAIAVPTKNLTKKVLVSIYRMDNNLAIDVIDNGIGIPKSQMEDIWKAGFSTKESTGLGLAFGKKVIEDNGGTINIDSTVDVGTTVRMTLPNEECVERE